jgi:hypothetical protein
MAPGAPSSSGPRDFASALEDAPAEVAAPMEGDSDLDAEQAALAEQMGMNPSEASALKQFVRTCKMG